MNKRSRTVAIVLFFGVLFAYLGCFGLVGGIAEANAQTEMTKEEEKQAKAEAKLKMKLEKKFTLNFMSLLLTKRMAAITRIRLRFMIQLELHWKIFQL